MKRALTFADENVTLDIDNVVLGESVHGNFRLCVTFAVCYERCRYLLLRASTKKKYNRFKFNSIQPTFLFYRIISMLLISVT